MAWYDNTPGGWAGNQVSPTLQGWFGYGAGDPANASRAALQGQASAAGAFGAQGAAGFGADTAALNTQAGYLRDLQSGKNSVSAEQLRQSLGQNLAAQQSMAASAAPNDQAMAARNAAMNMSRLGYGMAGQQAVAGLQERQNATMALGNMLGNMRGQDVNAATGGYGAAMQGYGTAVQNPQKTFWNSGAGPAAMSAMSSGGGMMAMSDERVKTDVRDGSGAVNATMDALKAYTFSYKDEKHGKGTQTGVMAQDLERAGLAHAVVETAEGKAVHGAKLATSNTAMIAELNRRVRELEGR